MKSVLKLSALVATCFVIAECRFLQPQIRESEPFHELYRCQLNTNTNCIAPHLDHYDDIFDTPQSVRSFLADRQNLEGMAEDAHVAAACIRHEYTQPACAHKSLNESEYVEIQLISGFLNTPGNIDTLVAVSESPCLSDNPPLVELENQGTDCFMAFVLGLQGEGDPCDTLDNLRTCVVNMLGDVCGAAAGTLANSVWGYTMEHASHRVFAEIPIDADQCQLQTSVVRRYAKMGLDKLRR